MNKIEGLIGLTRRAGKLVVGTDNVLDYVRKNKVFLVLILNDASENTKKKLLDKCVFYGVESKEIENSANLERILNNNKKALGIADKGFAEAIKKG
ncbi:MAG: ribosomal L7Ae/L30e/S12e/Gadd45 family protein [Erysipelotrichales bacterium]|nr:ribosomal L7Ae/L30e/S12e/Gadd45 family protein [Erysipelotrichales bacterium]